MANTEQQYFDSNQDLEALYEQLLRRGAEHRSLSGGPGQGKNPVGYGGLATDYATGGFYNPKLYVDAYNKAFGHGSNAAKNAYKQAIGDWNERSRKEYDQQLKDVKNAMARQQLRNRVNQTFNSGQMQDLYNQIEQSILNNSLAGVTQQYADILKNQSFQTAGQGLVGSSIHAERLGDVQQGQNAAAIQAQNQARGYTNDLRNQNEQQRQRLVNVVSQPNPGQSQQFNAQIDAITNQTRMLGQQYANQAAGMQINQYGNQLQSQALGGLLSGAGNAYQGYQQGYDAEQQRRARGG